MEQRQAPECVSFSAQVETKVMADAAEDGADCLALSLVQARACSFFADKLWART